MNIYLLTRNAEVKSSEEGETEEIIRHTEPETTVRFVSRGEWYSEPVSNLLPTLIQPIENVVIAHTNSAPCLTQEECDRQINFLKALFIESKRKTEIPFNFLIGGDGRAYEITGWTRQADSLRGYDNRTVYLSFIGNFDKIIPSIQQLSVAKLLISEGLSNNYIKESYKLFGQCQLSGSVSSPGPALFQVIQQWPHWKSEV